MVDSSLPGQAFIDAVHESWPSSQADPAGRSGVACAIVVLRHLLVFFGPEDRKRFVGSLHLGKIPVLEQALLHSDKESLDAFFDKMKADLDADGLRFDSLMESRAMHEEVWETSDFSLFLEVAYRASPDGNWGPPPPPMTSCSRPTTGCCTGTVLTGRLPSTSLATLERLTGATAPGYAGWPPVPASSGCATRARTIGCDSTMTCRVSSIS
jgi:hypothetical protein